MVGNISQRGAQLFLAFVVLLLVSETVRAQTAYAHQTKLSEVALFHRCYAHLTRLRPPKNHPILAQVAAGTKTAINGCLEVLDRAKFSDAGELPVKDKEAVAVLTTLYHFHRSWFAVNDFIGTPQTYTDGEFKHNDATEGALALTLALFDHNARNYSDVITTMPSVRATRSLGPFVRANPPAALEASKPHVGLQRGDLWGIKQWSSDENNVWYGQKGTPFVTFPVPYRSYTFESKRSYGGGAIGFQSYFWMNSGFPSNGDSDNANEARSSVSNASIRMHRRWAKNVLHDFLCRDIPVLRTSDVNTMVEEYLTAFKDVNPKIPFRQSTSCMSCHATIDPMAATVRNLIFLQAAKIVTVDGKGKYDYLDWNEDGQTLESAGDKHSATNFVNVSVAAETKPYHLLHRTSDFFRRPPNGYLRYRSYDGTYVEEPIVGTVNNTDGVTKLGQILAQKKDYYVCAASRYFEYFTGIKPILYDPGDPRNPALSDADKYYKNMVINLGTRLQSHQRLRTLIQEILSSEIYQKNGMRDLEP